MNPGRRTMLALTLAGGALGVTGCMSRINRRSHGGGLDRDRLARGFAPLAARAKPGIFSLGAMTFDEPAVWCADQNTPFPMQNLVAAPLAAAALAEVDAGRLHLNEVIRIGPEDLSPPPSVLNRMFPPPGGKGFIEAPAADLIALAVQEGDNTAADAILQRIGGPGAVTSWLRERGVTDMRVDRYERQLLPAICDLESFRPAWKDDAGWAAAKTSIPPPLRERAMAAYLADPRDTTTTQAALNFLNQLSGGYLLSPASTGLLLRLMTASKAGPHRLRAGLPPGARLAHQAGSTDTDLGLTPVTNDIGLVTLANGRSFAIAALLSGSTATAAQRDAVIADGARLVAAALI